jgi:hypothetical protein
MSWTNVYPEVVNIPQSTASTCWLACLKMLYVWKGKSADEPLQKLNADPNIFPDYWLDKGVGPEDCLTIARCLGLGRAGDGDADAEVLARALKTHGPYWVAGEWKKGYAHVKVVVGCDPEGDRVKLVNPWNPTDPVDYATLAGFNNRGDRWKVFGTFMYWSS